MKVHTQKISKLQLALSKLEDRIILASNKAIDEREYAISEIRYYKKLMENFFGYAMDLKADIIIDLLDMIEEVEKWLSE